MNNLIAVFDADGVFLRSSRPRDYLERCYGLTKEKMASFFPVLGECLIGQADMKAILPPFLEQWGIAESVDEFLDEAFNSGSEIDPGVMDEIKALREQGVTCCLATNQDEHRMAFLDQQLGIRDYFDETFVSCEMGMKKPSGDFYRFINARYPGCNLVFWDDKLENVSAAQECGWAAFAFKDVVALQADIARLLEQR